MGRTRTRRMLAALLLVGTMTMMGVGPSSAAGANKAARGDAGGDHDRAAPTTRDGRALAAGKRRVVPGSYVVQMADGVEVADLFPGSRRPDHSRFRHALNGFSAKLTPNDVERLADDPRVISVEADAVYETQTTQRYAPWGLDRIDQRQRPLDSSYTYGHRGGGVRIYVVDSGVTANHRDFGGRVLRGFDALGTGSTADCQGHGTHVASTAAGSRWGVAKRAWIVPVRVGCGDLALRNIVEGLDFVVRNHRAGMPAVANLSLGGPPSMTLDAAVRRVLKDGVTVVAAAGNSGYDACDYSPGRIPGVITVGATNLRDGIPLWSNYGTCIDLFAPGVDVRAASRVVGRTVAMSGTSMASPHAAGVAARFLGDYPRAAPSTVARALIGRTAPGLRDRFYGDPDRLLQMAGRTPTALTQSVSHSRVTFGEQLTVGGTLRNSVTGRPLAGRLVRLMHRPAGAAQWSLVGDAPTSSTGTVRIDTTPSQPGAWQLRHPRSTYGTRSEAAALAVGMTRATTTLSSAASPLVVEPGGQTRVSGVLRNGLTGQGLGGQTVIAEYRRAGTTTWGSVATATSTSAGAITFNHHPPATGHYRLRYPGTTWMSPATSAPVDVTTLVAATVDLWLSDTSIGEDDFVTIYGVVSPAGTGGTVTIQEYELDYGWGWSTLQQVAYGADGHFSYRYSPGWEGDYGYRALLPSTATTSAATSNTATLAVYCAYDWC